MDFLGQNFVEMKAENNDINHLRWKCEERKDKKAVVRITSMGILARTNNRANNKSLTINFQGILFSKNFFRLP